ncbi:MAG: hypothetical protein ACXADY_18665 [Candidatus Hodarchaeales archaeon]|jgi:hypothetical protein
MLIKSEERDEGRRLFTKYFSLNYDTLKNKIRLAEEGANVEVMKVKALIATSLMDRMIELSEEQNDIIESSMIKIIPLTMTDLSEEHSTRLNNNEESPFTHIKAQILIPIKEILERKARSDE